MFRVFAVILLTLSLPFSAVAQGMRPMNEVSIVALIITSGDETPVSASVIETLESLDAQTLTAIAPNASEMRSILKRFTDAAIDTDIALVFFDGAVLKIGDRDFVAPGGITLRRPTDLLTKAIPLSALARATALAGNGGAVLVHSSGQDIELIDGISLVVSAPLPRSGTSPVLFAEETAATRLANGLKAMSEAEGDIDLTEALGMLSALDGITISQLPTRPVKLRALPAPIEVTPTVEASAAQPVATEDTVATADEPTGLALPQVGESPETVAAAVEEPDPATNAAAETADATSTPPAETIDTTVDTTVATATVETVAEPAEEVAAAPEFSLDVLRAMQGAVPRAQKRVIQRHLRNLGFYRGLIDGIFGRQTEAAIVAYQNSISVDVTGVLTPAQLELLSN